MEITRNDDQTYDIWGDCPVKMTFFNSDEVVMDGEVYNDVGEFSVIVKGGFDVLDSEGVMENEKLMLVDNPRKTLCDNIEILKPPVSNSLQL